MRQSPAMASALAHRSFRIFWIGTVLTYTSQWVQQVTLSWAAYQITGSLTIAGLILGGRAVPMFLLAPFSGVAAERYDRRSIILVGQVALAIGTAVIGGLFAAGAIEAWHLAAYVVLSGVATLFDRNARHAMILDLVPRDLTVSAVSLVGIAQSGARLAAPAAAGALLAATGIATNFFLQSALYVLVVATQLMIRLPKRVTSAAEAPALVAVRDGLRLAYTDRNLRVLVITGVLPFVFVFGGWNTLFPALVRDSFGAGAAALGWIMTGIGAGGLAGGLASTRLARFDRPGLVQTVAQLVLGAGVIGVSIAPNVPVAVGFAFLIGVGEMLHWATNQTLVQLATPADYRGRITSLLAVFPAFISIGSIWTGWLGEAVGARFANGLVGLASIALAVATFFFAPRLIRMRFGSLRGREPAAR